MKLKDDYIFEKYLDSEEQYYDYGTSAVTGTEIVDVHKTGMSFYDEFLTSSGREYLENKKNLSGKIVYMSPDEYYNKCATRIFNTTVEKLKQEREADKRTLAKLKNVLQVYKRKLCMPMINYADRGQEGLHRMYVIGELYGWNHKVPVLVVDWHDKEKHEREAAEKKKHKIDLNVEKAVTRAYKYRYKNLDEFEQQLQWELDKVFEFSDEISTPVTFELKSRPSLILVFNGYEYPIEEDEINFVEESEEDKLDDIEVDDLDNIDDWIVKYLGNDWMNTYPDAKNKITKNESVDVDTYHRFEVVDDQGINQGGIFRGLNKLLNELWNEDSLLYDELNEPLSELEYLTPYPDGLEDTRIKFAYKSKFYTDNSELFDDIEYTLNELGWNIVKVDISKPSNIVYEDESQIAYIMNESLIEDLNNLPDKLYHATFLPRWEEIKKSGGLQTNTKYKNYEDSRNVICMEADPDAAYSYAEVAMDDMEEELPIVILEINTSYLDTKFIDVDKNICRDEDDEITSYEYMKNIPLDAINIYSEN